MCSPLRVSPGGKVEKILVAGGYDHVNKVFLAEVIVYDISSNTWETGTCNCYGGSGLDGFQ